MAVVTIEVSRSDALLMMRAVIQGSQDTRVLRDQSTYDAHLRACSVIEEAIAEHDAYEMEAE